MKTVISQQLIKALEKERTKQENITKYLHAKQHQSNPSRNNNHDELWEKYKKTIEKNKRK